MNQLITFGLPVFTLLAGLVFGAFLQHRIARDNARVALRAELWNELDASVREAVTLFVRITSVKGGRVSTEFREQSNTFTFALALAENAAIALKVDGDLIPLIDQMRDEGVAFLGSRIATDTTDSDADSSDGYEDSPRAAAMRAASDTRTRILELRTTELTPGPSFGRLV